MSKQFSALERRFRPFAAFALVVMVASQIIGTWALLSPGVSAATQSRTGMLTPLFVLGAVAAVLSVLVAVYALAHDETVTPRARMRWMLAVIFTNVFGGPLFLVVRWWRDHPRILDREGR